MNPRVLVPLAALLACRAMRTNPDTATAPASAPQASTVGERPVGPTAAPTQPPTPEAPPAPPTPAPAPGANVASLGGCAMFPADNPWNRDISHDPLDPRSDAIIANIQSHGDRTIKADFGSNPEYGIPFVVVPATQPMVPVRFTEYGDESDPGPYPVPPNAPIEGGNDDHVLVLQQGRCRLFEMYHAHREANGWAAGSGAVFDLSSNRLRTREWTSCDQAGLPILPGLTRVDEVQSGAIRHALRVTFEHTQNAWIEPATHPGGDDDADAPPMGLRLRLKANFDISRFTGQSRVILEALKRYGLMTADTGANWYISGATDSRWNDDDLQQLQQVPGTAFEVVRSGALQHRR